MNVSYLKLEKFLEKLFLKAGYSAPHAKLISGSLTTTSLRGVDSHGIRLAPHYIRALKAGRINSKPKFKFKNTAPGVSVLDADHGHGIVAGTEAMKKAVANAKKVGIGAVAVKNSNHFAAAAIYSIPAARENMIGICFTQAEAMISPHGSKKSFFGTNPICFAAPVAGEDPFCLDMATAAVTRNRVLYCKENGLELSPGCALDQDGSVTVDPLKVASLLPFGTYKGSGLAMMVEIFSSLMTGMPFGPFVQPMLPVSKDRRKLGQFFIAIDIKRFQSVPLFKKRLKEMMNIVREQPPASGFDRVLVAGDPEKMTYTERVRSGIPVGEELMGSFKTFSSDLGVKMFE
jgi:ureidoglycolate dehydrogenase (NAD+)